MVKHCQRRQRLLIKKYTLKSIIIEINRLSASVFSKSHLSVKIVARDEINDVSRIDFGDAVLQAFFFLKS